MWGQDFQGADRASLLVGFHRPWGAFYYEVRDARGTVLTRAARAGRKEVMGDAEDKPCPVCGIPILADDAKEIEALMDADNKTCPECLMTFGEIRRAMEREVDP